MLGAGARGRSREMIWGGRWEGGSGLGTHVHPWQIHVNVWQNQYSIVKQNQVKIKFKEEKALEPSLDHLAPVGPFLYCQQLTTTKFHDRYRGPPRTQYFTGMVCICLAASEKMDMHR